ncbi:acyl carrier protein [Helicobacter aurati]|uniref:Acyl carrier protein n=1 Tax=Helicobacter aurati TaxID=137778 RepID=A0A3D8IX44_9HELI|nr:acyl carrier protein [Helicobacter aurati]RDU69822.1 acyl carrier protein [Helicobacter aurati]
MTKEELIEAIEDILMIDLGTLELDKNLNEYEDWDSMAHLSLLALFDSKLQIKIKPKDIRTMQTARDILLKAQV